VRIPTEFIEAVVNDEMWALTSRKDGDVMKKLKARDLWRQIAEAAWACADPGVQFDTTINEWHTSPAEGRIRASNPCSEYMFLDNTACNLASLNLVKFYDDEEQAFDIDAYLHAIRLWTMVLEISVTMAQFPSREIAEGSYNYRTLGLGYANLGSLLMRSGIPYDSDEGRAIAGTLTAVHQVRDEQGLDAAGHPQPPPGGLQRRPRGVRRREPLRHGHRSRRGPGRFAPDRPARVGQRPQPRRAARLP
jgi:ribonucleoside-diphosphate reductase alpha chain